MKSTPRGMRLHIAIFGRRNAGKSSLLNAMTSQQSSIVSEVAGTTTDPVEKPMEMLPVGPVLFIDTAGLDDTGSLGELRVSGTRKVFDRADIAIIVIGDCAVTEYEKELLEELERRSIAAVIVFNKVDLRRPGAEVVAKLREDKFCVVETAATEGDGIAELREAVVKSVPEEFINQPAILGDLVGAGGLAILVVPIDMEAPKGRLILPQVQSIRDLLDNDSYCMVVKERELRDALERLKRAPELVVTDSQAFLKVAADTPDDILMTSFSILFARFKGDLNEFVRGALAIESLRPGDKVLITEACTHHPIGEDIGTVKIPRWLRQYVGGAVEFEHVRGHDFPTDSSELGKYKLVVHCGSCTLNRREVLSRILHCRAAGVPITNYGVAISYSLGIFERALRPFPSASEIVAEYRRMV